MRQNELANCTFVKTILMLLIVFYHSILFWSGDWFTGKPMFEAKPMIYVADWLNSFHIYGFTLISGYLFYYVRFEREGYARFIPFVMNKAKRLLIPYIFVAVFWVIPISSVFFHYSAEDLIYKYVLGTSPSQLWFLLMLFGVFTIFWPLSQFLKRHSIVGIGIILGLYGLGLIGGKFFPNIFMVWTACMNSSVFYVGFKIRQEGSNVIRKIPSVIWILLDVLIFAVCELLSKERDVIFKILSLGGAFVLHIVGSIMAFVVLQNLAEQHNWSNSYFNFFSERSMPVYLLHQQIIYFFIWWLNGLINSYLNAAINFAGSLTLSLILATVLMKFKTTRFLIGEKSNQTNSKRG